MIDFKQKYLIFSVLWIRWKIFFSELNVKNLEIFFDISSNLTNKFMLRGLPTTVFINKNGEEFARIVGWYDFSNEKFINWLKEYNWSLNT